MSGRTDWLRGMRRLAFSGLQLALVASCQMESPPAERRTPPRAGTHIEVRTSPITAGPAQAHAPVRNPYDGNVHAQNEGQRLYEWFNCGGCHGPNGGGGMGPPLRDEQWIYGQEPQQIYQSIVQGRPQGMPAYGATIAEDQIWKLVAFIQTLGGTPGLEEPRAPLPGREEAPEEPTEPAEREREDDPN